jgi:ribosomal-protein-alanine N-acetyltransferase
MGVTSSGGLVLKNMGREDLPGVLGVEAASFALPWTPAMFSQELDSSHGWARVAQEGTGGRVVAFIVCRLYGDLWHIMDLAVEPHLRGKGLGGLLLDDFLAAALPGGADLTLEVRPSNAAAMALYRRRGFQVMGIRPRYYSDSGEDALVMTRLGSQEPPCDGGVV